MVRFTTYVEMKCMATVAQGLGGGNGSALL